ARGERQDRAPAHHLIDPVGDLVGPAAEEARGGGAGVDRAAAGGAGRLQERRGGGIAPLEGLLRRLDRGGGRDPLAEDRLVEAAADQAVAGHPVEEELHVQTAGGGGGGDRGGLVEPVVVPAVEEERDALAWIDFHGGALYPRGVARRYACCACVAAAGSCARA